MRYDLLVNKFAMKHKPEVTGNKGFYKEDNMTIFLMKNIQNFSRHSDVMNSYK